MGKRAPIGSEAVSNQASAGQQVRDVMRRDFITISGEEGLREAVDLMRLARLRHLPVVSNGILVGILSYRDLQDQRLASIAPPEGEPDSAVFEGMTRSPFSIVADATLFEAASRLARLRVGCLPVVEPGEQGPRLVGLLTEMDLLRAVFRI
jgi:CBS domain-containing protein